MANQRRKQEIMARNKAMYGKDLGAIHTKMDVVATDPALSDAEKTKRLHDMPENNSASVAIRSMAKSMNPINRHKAKKKVKKYLKERAAKSHSKMPTNKAPRRRRPS